MNPFEFVLAIILMAFVFTIVKHRLGIRTSRWDNCGTDYAERDEENDRLREQVKAMQDRIHQPYRAALIPGFEAALQGALDAGAAGACLSGSGSTMLALTTGSEAAIGEAMAAAVRAAGVEARWLALDVDTEGTVIVPQSSGS